ncbi:MAG: meromycolic acid enoyl-[acyl-carrier-protein] reductase [Actinomycetota bacterium]|jgi:enoyl ACP reductase|nr:meromycolic acid enoyl-[acyl-carrier-protein] reductase [Actinomycetota bacterium]
MEGRRLLVTGVLTRESIAFEVARTVQEQGAEIVLTGFGRARSLTDRVAKKLPQTPDVLEMDINQPDQIEDVAKEIERRWGSLDGVLHAIAFAPPDALGGNFLATPWESAQVAFQTSAYSLKALAERLLPVMSEDGASIVSLDFDASVAWPVYDWMGVSKAALEAVTRYLARDLGRRHIRVNCVSAGPIRTMAAKGIPGFKRLEEGWAKRAPLGWDTTDPAPVAKAVAFLLSEWSVGITGEIVHVDGGYHAMGADLDPATGDGEDSPSPEQHPQGE